MSGLTIRGGRVIDPARGIDAVTDVHVEDGRIVDAPAGGARTIDAAGMIVAPGLIDLHTHVYADCTSLGVEPDPIAMRSGCATLVDAGSAGAGNIMGFARFFAAASRVRLLAYLNISFAGIFGFGRRVMVGECADLALLNVEDCVEAARAHAGLIVGIKVRAGRNAGGWSGLDPVRLAIEAADELGLPVMAHVDYPPPGRDEVLAILRPGDILTHCYRPFPNAPTTGDGSVRETVRAARERGIGFDIGHGMGSFSFRTARAMIEGDAGGPFLPDAVSSDVHALCADGPAVDNLVTMTKFLALGVPLPDVIAMASAGPASVLGRTGADGRPALGTLGPGAVADVTLLSLEDEPIRLTDSVGETITSPTRLRVRGLIAGGRRLV